MVFDRIHDSGKGAAIYTSGSGVDGVTVHRHRVSPALRELSGGNHLPPLTLKGVGDNGVNSGLTLLKVLARW